jgi:hypothetical protein
MNYFILGLICLSLVSCSKSSDGGGSPNTAAAVIDDTLNKLYHVINEDDSNVITKLEFYENDTVKVTKADNSSEVLIQKNIDEGIEDDVDLVLSGMCEGESSGETKYVEIKLTKQSDDSFDSNVGAIVWEGTCGGQAVSCAAMVVYDVDPVVENESSPTQGYMFGLNNPNGCSPIQSSVQSLLDNLFEI